MNTKTEFLKFYQLNTKSFNFDFDHDYPYGVYNTEISPKMMKVQV